ncbi:MAG: HAMP domain-containing sensor histidine kinase [Devosia sp.]|nr:HAMP domain-containing sensor histidine kinase [Devosia sp.]
MSEDWIKSPMARRVLVHWADARPAWLWSGDGKSLLWRNAAARFFNARLKKHGLKLAPEPVPIKGQVARLVRLGSVGRSSLSRIQFLAGERPVSATCTVTPLEMPGGAGLLIVGADPIEPQVLASSTELSFDSLTEALFPPGPEYLVVEDGKLRGGTRRGMERFGPAIEAAGVPVLPESGSGEVQLAGRPVTLTRFKAGPQDVSLLLIETLDSDAGKGRIEDVRAAEGLAVLADRMAAGPEEGEEPLLPMGLPPIEEPVDSSDVDRDRGVGEDEYWAEPIQPPAVGPGRSLSSLFDRLADHDELYAPLPERQEPPHGRLVNSFSPADEPAAEGDTPRQGAEAPRGDEPDVIAAVIEFAEDNEEPDNDRASVSPVTCRVIGRGFRPMVSDAVEPETGGSPSEAPSGGPATRPTDASETPDREIVERVSRYNFDELSRILTDRVGTETTTAGEPVEIEPAIEPPRRPAMAGGTEGALVNIAAETFILNRLPIGIMVFRDQQVQFANRALTDLTGYETVDALRAAGLAAIFPSEDAANTGPVTHLVNRSGTLLPVTARLQSISWQGRPALMLSASLAETRIGHEGVVKAFAEALAELREEGFFTADRAGFVTGITVRGRDYLGGADADLLGKPLSTLLDPKGSAALRAFLEQPARFAETARPSLAASGAAPRTDLLIFAEGQAGIVSGYFGFVRRTPAAGGDRKGNEDIEPSMLARVSRGVRRPLNTIIGFSDLIRSAAFGTIENQRYLEYARDIKTAGQEIAVLVDELDDFARLKEGRYAAQPADLDLGALLETCVVRVRAQASDARVLVRSAISERLPRIRADQASMRQAVLNLLASAIDQTPVGGTVVLSAQVEDDGGVAVNVRDSGGHNADPGERFVVFRDGIGKDGEALRPVRSSVGLALTRSLLAVNTCSLSVDPSAGVGTLFSLVIPVDLVTR